MYFQRGPSSLKKCSSVYHHADFPERDCLYRFDELLFWIHFHILVFQTTTKIMISDIQLAIFANVLGVSLFLLVQHIWVMHYKYFIFSGKSEASSILLSLHPGGALPLHSLKPESLIQQHQLLPEDERQIQKIQLLGKAFVCYITLWFELLLKCTGTTIFDSVF